MTYAQVRGGQKLHLVYEPGEGDAPERLIPAGRLGLPFCGRHVPAVGYRMTINVPLTAECKNCRRVYAAKC